jgi:hypothetical protein
LHLTPSRFGYEAGRDDDRRLSNIKTQPNDMMLEKNAKAFLPIVITINFEGKVKINRWIVRGSTFVRT